MSAYLGGCLCGQIRFRIAAEPAAVRLCWCRDCQRLAANGTANALFPTAAIEITGTPAAHVRAADSGNQVTRRFCPACGSQLFSDSSGRPGSTVVRLGVLDEPSALRPTAQIWTASAPTWACLDPALEAHPKAAPAPAAPATPAQPPAARA
ncbi:GFA family protein [Pseudaquabacterium rugosum]|uniref:GFA family protein n=1 Tax=Pseudaquabacterium rugosum TaxID=2984194 RepID=A0ABU9BAZ2_9BURK